ncbi:DUF3467 domain-containing protein [Methylocaldum sp. MU1018]
MDDQYTVGYQGPDPREGKYANYVKVGHNAFEFVLDFGQVYSEAEEPQLHTRIVTSPVYAKAFLETLRDPIDQYEHRFEIIGNGKAPIGGF